jgi:hypothetical protein
MRMLKLLPVLLLSVKATWTWTVALYKSYNRCFWRAMSMFSAFVQAMDLPPQDLANYEILICVDGSVDRRRYNAPTSNEVAGLMLGE